MRITEIDNYKNYDNPTNTELDKEMKQADDMYWKKKAKEFLKRFKMNVLRY